MSEQRFLIGDKVRWFDPHIGYRSGVIEQIEGRKAFVSWGNWDHRAGEWVDISRLR